MEMNILRHCELLPAIDRREEELLRCSIRVD